MKKVGLAIVLSFLLLFILFFIKEKLSQAQSSIGIELYVYPKGFYGGGLIRVANKGVDNYKTSRYAAVIGNTEYKLLLKRVGTATFTLTFFKLADSSGGPLPLGASEYSGTCSDFKGKLINNDCEIIGTFKEPASSRYWELWEIMLRKDNKSTSTSFYLVKQSYAQTSTIASNNDQYYLEPISTTTEPTSTISYTVYSNKLYCPNYMASGISTTTPSPVSGSFVHFRVASSSFLSNDYVVTNLGLNGISEGVYELYLVNSLNERIGPSSPVEVTITVKSPSTPPPGSFLCEGTDNNWCRCVFSYCYWLDPNTGQWSPTSSSACGDVCAGGVRE